MQIDVKEFAALFDDTPTDRSSSWKRRSGFVGKLQEYLKSSKIPWSCKNWHLGNIHRFWTNPAVDVRVQCERCVHQKFMRATLSEIGRPTPSQNLYMALGCYIGQNCRPHQEFRSCGPFFSDAQWLHHFDPTIFRLPNRMSSKSSLVLCRLSTKL